MIYPNLFNGFDFSAILSFNWPKVNLLVDTALITKLCNMAKPFPYALLIFRHG